MGGTTTLSATTKAFSVEITIRVNWTLFPPRWNFNHDDADSRPRLTQKGFHAKRPRTKRNQDLSSFDPMPGVNRREMAIFQLRKRASMTFGRRGGS